MEAVAPRDHVALQFLLLALVPVADPRALAVDVAERDGLGLEEERPAARQARFDQVLHDLGLAVDDDRLAGQLVERDPVPLVLRLELDAGVHQPFAPHPLSHAGALEELGHVVLQHTCPNPGLDVLAAPALQDHRVDPVQVEQLRQREPRRPGADDPDLRPDHAAGSSPATTLSITRWAMANAPFAAGTPQ